MLLTVMKIKQIIKENSVHTSIWRFTDCIPLTLTISMDEWLQFAAKRVHIYVVYNCELHS